MISRRTRITTLLISNLATSAAALLLAATACALVLRPPTPQSSASIDPSAHIESETNLPPKPNASVEALVAQWRSILQATQLTIKKIPSGLQQPAQMLAAFREGTNQLRAIDTSKCPLDFQLACLTYRQARESYVASMPPGDPVELLLDLGIHFAGGSRDGGMSKASDAVDAEIKHLNDSMHNLERIALRHGVKL